MKHVICLLCSSMLLSACTVDSLKSPPTSKTQTAPPTTLSGTLTKGGSTYFLNTPGEPLTTVYSYGVKLEDYTGQTIRVTGRYSGATFFVDKVE